MGKKVLTGDEVRAGFLKRGETFTAWAKANGFDQAAVAQVVNGQNQASRGVGHQIAVKLGMKEAV